MISTIDRYLESPYAQCDAGNIVCPACCGEAVCHGCSDAGFRFSCIEEGCGNHGLNWHKKSAPELQPGPPLLFRVEVSLDLDDGEITQSDWGPFSTMAAAERCVAALAPRRDVIQCRICHCQKQQPATLDEMRVAFGFGRPAEANEKPPPDSDDAPADPQPPPELRDSWRDRPKQL